LGPFLGITDACSRTKGHDPHFCFGQGRSNMLFVLASQARCVTSTEVDLMNNGGSALEAALTSLNRPCRSLLLYHSPTPRQWSVRQVRSIRLSRATLLYPLQLSPVRQPQLRSEPSRGVCPPMGLYQRSLFVENHTSEGAVRGHSSSKLWGISR
jgi:hypothetical protein